ncbi:MAG: molecular chaperone HtpG [Alphaproteobacteria bacterium]|jgi:molecular chaperone HtpG|nr:molecular chaperone HtpG [Alphaproteobacteria bacterium]
MSEERLAFQAEVSRLLKLMVHSVYSEKEIFLRELISNASDACDKLRYEALTKPELAADDPEFRVRVVVDAKARTIEVADNGIGMSRDELISELGTIARSGTGAFLEQLTGDDAKDVALIGQFGVGFYSVFMVADTVEVTSRRAGEAAAWRWSSDGGGEFTVTEAERPGCGTSVVVHLAKDEKRWLEPETIRAIVKTYSDHIALPIVLVEGETEETVNQASALWTRPKREIEEEQYKEFYHHAGHAFDDPWLTIHYKAEGKIEYAVLLFVPSAKPYDLYDPSRKNRVKLYVKRVFITDDCQELIPPYLRFLKGVVDSEDLPLNISREMLQASPVLARLKTAITRRVLNELKKKAEKAPEDYAAFWEGFGAVLKEGIYEDEARRDDILALARFHSTAGDEATSLDAYLERAKEGQQAIYYISGDDLEALRQSPQIEGYRARGIEVLLLTDAVDNFWLTSVDAYAEKPFRSVTRGAADLAEIAPEGEAETPADEVREADIATVIVALKQSLGEAVKDVRASERLTDSAVCLVADEGDLDMHLERLLKAQQQIDFAATRILEINPRHQLIRALAERVKGEGGGEALADVAHLLLDQARIVEGESLPDPAAFSRRLAAVMARGLAA